MERVKTILVNICRLLTGVVFILSGYVKAIDPLGTQYKIEDYLEAVGMVGMVPDWLTLATSILLSMVEFAIGMFIFLGIRRRLTTKVLLVFISVMTLVTVWLAAFNPIKDCGCFGDAVKLTNGQTLMKNIVLLACAIVMWRWPLRIVMVISKANQWIAINYTIFFILASSLWSLWTLPQFDFRPYHIGANIRKGMEIPEGAEQPEFENTFIMEKDGKRQEFTLDNYPDSTWTYIDTRTVQTREGYVPPIHDFSIEDTRTGEDITQQVLSRKGYTFLLIAPHLEQADDVNFGDIDQIYEYANENGYPFYCLTASGEKGISHWQDITGAEYPFCTTDETTLKTMVRSNPGLILIKDGTIIRKWSHNDLPKLDYRSPRLEKNDMGRMPADNTVVKTTRIILWFVLPLTLLVIADRLFALSRFFILRRKDNAIGKDAHEGTERKE